MSRYVITIEDAPNGDVYIESDPAPETLHVKAQDPDSCTPADAYVMAAWVAVINASHDHAEETGKSLIIGTLR